MSSSSSSFPWAFTAACDVVWCEISLGSVGISGPGCAPSQLLADLQPPRWWDRVGKREKLKVVQALLSNSQNTSVLSALFYSQIQNSVLYGLLWRQSTSSQPGSVKGVSWDVQYVGDYLQLWAPMVDQGVSSPKQMPWKPLEAKGWCHHADADACISSRPDSHAGTATWGPRDGPFLVLHPGQSCLPEGTCRRQLAKHPGTSPRGEVQQINFRLRHTF